MCRTQKKQKKIDDLLDNVNNILLALENIPVKDEDSRQLREDAILSTITIKAALLEFKGEKKSGDKERPS